MIQAAKSRIFRLWQRADRKRILEEWNDTSRDYPQKSIGELFELQAKTRPNAIAISTEEDSWTYRELEAACKSNRSRIESIRCDA
jgi:non-ribosomal peptide synthetase component F